MAISHTVSLHGGHAHAQGRPGKLRRALPLVRAVLVCVLLAACGGGSGGDGAGGGGGGGAYTPSGPAGTLDTDFNTTGYLVHNSAAGGLTRYDRAFDVKVDSQQRLVVVGSSQDATADTNMVVWRFTEAGVPDTSFGDDADANGTRDGWLVRDDPTGDSGSDIAKGLQLDGTGYLVAGEVKTGFFQALGLWRFDENGDTDAAFGTAGFVGHTAGGGAHARGHAIAKDAQGKILVTGHFDQGMVLWRFSAAGVLDTAGFNAPNGYLTSAIAAGWAVTPNGTEILVGGHTGQIAIPDDSMIWRVDATGTSVTTLSQDAFTLGLCCSAKQVDETKAMILDGSGRILLLSHFYDNAAGKWNLAVARYTNAGALDTTFNAAGGVPGVAVYLAADAGYNNARGEAIAVDSLGRIVVAGYLVDGSAQWDMAVWRFASDGTLDTTFNAGTTPGYFVHDNAAGGSGNDGAYAVTVDQHDRVIAAGFSAGSGTLDDMVVWRLNP